MTVGILGGTFDPPHLGHLAAAQEALETCGLQRVLFMPSERNPLKLDNPISPTHHRLAMTELAIADDPRYELSRADIGGDGPSFTVDLLARLKLDPEIGPDLAFIGGMDILHELHRWRDPERLLKLARLIVIARPGLRTIPPADLDTRVPGASRRVTVVDTPGVAISSTELRVRVAAGRSIRYLATDAVAAYIRDHGLYQTGGEGRGARGE